MKKTPAPGQVRIIGGQWRGRKLPVPDSPGLRPTTDRIRETLFNWLAPHIAGARCLDCFAGSGALAFEALSRHAAQVTLLEANRAIARQLEKNLLSLSTALSAAPSTTLPAAPSAALSEKVPAPRGQVIHTDTLNYLTHPPVQMHNIVFVDPPFRQGLLVQTLYLLENQGWLAPGALIYVECEREQGAPVAPASWQLLREKTAGQVMYRLYRR